MTKEEKLLKVIALQKQLLEKNQAQVAEKDELDKLIESLEANLAGQEKVIQEQSVEIQEKDKEIEELVTTEKEVSSEDILAQLDELIKN